MQPAGTAPPPGEETAAGDPRAVWQGVHLERLVGALIVQHQTASRHREAEPGRPLEPGIAGLLHGRHLQQRRHTIAGVTAMTPPLPAGCSASSSQATWGPEVMTESFEGWVQCQGLPA